MKKGSLTPQQLFCQLLDQLAVNEYRELHKKIGITKKMLTHMRNAPHSATYEMTLKFAKALNVDPVELIDLYDFGASRITVEEYKGLK
ncbi:helix-turn-helix transcriptional regulator [Aureispira sp. CCB-E]|uniref:helix-turn-helix domain-containing protein n=1 Tax=Aureispira sp. CCB-E TaxID=3051121 RepID=UPI00286868FC|nr:helix-turn-helix transcriptional regulator [Aureispira sp. CCB-E]WMX15912.1 helix-turn-helix transcriptional regulator [Aureispira sp. CCB-E]WMX16575.1 helix-turn-helix transcriptional regulator [Aureispira sp. CCB-E]